MTVVTVVQDARCLSAGIVSGGPIIIIYNVCIILKLKIHFNYSILLIPGNTFKIFIVCF